MLYSTHRVSGPEAAVIIEGPQVQRQRSPRRLRIPELPLSTQARGFTLGTGRNSPAGRGRRTGGWKPGSAEAESGGLGSSGNAEIGTGSSPVPERIVKLGPGHISATHPPSPRQAVRAARGDGFS